MAPNGWAARMFPERIYRVTDPSSGLEAGLGVVHAGDGGAFAVALELRNPSAGRDVVLKVNAELSAFVMLTVTDPQGNVLSNPPRKFDSSEQQHFDLVRIAREPRRWRIPVAAQVQPSAIPPQGLNGRLVLNVALLFSQVAPGAPPGETFESSILTLYDMDVPFTRAALTAAPGP